MTEAARHQDTKTSRRSASRLAAVQVIYQLFFRDNDKTPAQALQEYSQQLLHNRADADSEEGLSIDPDLPFLKELVEGVMQQQAAIDPLLAAHLSTGWTLLRLDPIVLSAMRAGVYELQHVMSVPAKVVVSEYVDVVAAFAQEQEVGFVNSMLDGLAKELRPQENA